MPMPKAAGSTPRYDQRPVEDDQVRLAILDALLTGKTPKTVALDVGYHPSEVQKVAGFHGWPNATYLQRARDTLADRITHPEKYAPAKKAAEPAAKADTDAPRAKAKQPAPQAPTRPKPVKETTGRVTPTATVTGDVITAEQVDNPRPSSSGSLSDLINRGISSPNQTTQAIARLARNAVAALRDALAAEQQPAAVVAAPAPAVERKKRKPPAVTAFARQAARLESLGVTGADVKTWGADHGFAITRGPILVRGLLDAYEEAHR